jgi:hypothetical protein
LFLDKEKNSIRVADHESALANINLILEDIRSAEHVSDLAEAAMNQTIWEVIEKHGFKDKSANPMIQENALLGAALCGHTHLGT